MIRRSKKGKTATAHVHISPPGIDRERIGKVVDDLVRAQTRKSKWRCLPYA